MIPNVIEPINLLKNFFSGFYFISSAAVGEFANWYYEDWFSFSYWLGDIVYRILIINNRDVEFIFPNFKNVTDLPME